MHHPFIALAFVICGGALAGTPNVRRLPHNFVEANEVRQARRHQFFDAERGGAPKNLCKYESAIASRPPAGKVALTFDDGPSRELTPWILATLAKYKAPATFFLKAQRASRIPWLIPQILKAGHLIGNHSWDHPNFHQIDVAAQARSINLANQFLNPVLGPLRLFRYPYGNATCESNALVRSLGYRIVGWHEDSCDWAFDRTGVVDERDARLCDVAPQNYDNFVGHVLQTIHARRGGVLLMHEIHRNTIRQLDDVLRELSNAGYTFVSLADPSLLAEIH